MVPQSPLSGLLYLKGLLVEGWLRSQSEEVVGRRTGEGKLRLAAANHTPPSHKALNILATSSYREKSQAGLDKQGSSPRGHSI